jgi:hypothetical protein
MQPAIGENYVENFPQLDSTEQGELIKQSNRKHQL